MDNHWWKDSVIWGGIGESSKKPPYRQQSHCIVNFQKLKMFLNIQRQIPLEIRLSNWKIKDLLFEAVPELLQWEWTVW